MVEEIMEAILIPDEQRSVGMCRGCKTNHKCSWNIGGQYFCGDCADKKRGVTEEPKVQQVENGIQFQTPPQHVPAQNSLAAQFTLDADEIINISIAKLATGYVANIDGQNHVFAKWHDLIDRLELLEAQDGNN